MRACDETQGCTSRGGPTRTNKCQYSRLNGLASRLGPSGANVLLEGGGDNDAWQYQ